MKISEMIEDFEAAVARGDHEVAVEIAAELDEMGAVAPPAPMMPAGDEVEEDIRW